MKFITNVKSNLKTGPNIALDRKTLLLGPNEAGKSAITDTLYLALEGFIPNLAGKDRAATGANNSALLWLIPEDEDEVHATVEFSDGTVAEYKTQGGRADWTLPAWMAQSVVFNLRDLRSMLRDKGDDVRRQFFLSKGATSPTEPEILARIPEDLHATWARLAKSESPPERLSEVQKGARSNATRLRSELKGAKSTLEDLAKALGQAPASATVERAQGQVTMLKERYDAHMKAESHNARIQHSKTSIEGRLVGYQQSVATAEANVQLLAANEPPTMPDNINIQVLEALTLLTKAQADRIEAGALGDCALCGVGPLDAGSAGARAQQVHAATHALIQGSSIRATWVGQVKQAQVTLMQARQALANVQDSLGKLGAAMGGQDPTAHAAYISAVQVVAQLEAQGNAGGKVQAARVKIDALEIDLANMLRLEKKCKEASAWLLATAVTGIEAQVTAFLPDGEAFKLVLERRNKKVCLIGLERKGRIDVALSDSTWDRVVLAIAAGLAQSADFALLIGEDRAYDPDTLRRTMVALTGSNAQLLLTSPIKHAGRCPKGWKVVNVVDDQKAPDVASSNAEPELLQGLNPVPDSMPGWVHARGACVWTGKVDDAPAQYGIGQCMAGPLAVVPDNSADLFILHYSGCVTRRLGQRVIVYEGPPVA